MYPYYVNIPVIRIPLIRRLLYSFELLYLSRVQTFLRRGPNYDHSYIMVLDRFVVKKFPYRRYIVSVSELFQVSIAIFAGEHIVVVDRITQVIANVSCD